MRHSQRSRSWRPDVRVRRGMVLPLTGITFFAMICFAGLALDTGHVYVVGQQLQAAADAAALAGAAQVQFDTVAAVTAATTTAGKNKEDQAAVSLSASDVQVGNYNRTSATFTANTAPYNAVKTTTRATANLLFAPVVNLVLNPGSTSTAYNTSNVSRQAIAMAGGTLAAGLVVLDPTRPSSFSSNGNTTITINGGGAIQVNSSSSTAVSVVGTAGDVNAGELRINGGISTSGHPSLPGKVYPNTTAVADPLAAMPAPTKSTNLGAVSVTNKNTTTNAGPGYYAGGITVKNGTLNLSPGVYVLGPPGLQLSGGAVNAPGVIFYLTTGTTGSTYANLDLSGGVINLSAPTSGPYAGVLIFMDRSAPYSNGVSLGGNSQATVNGVLYMPSVSLTLHGTSDMVVASQAIVATVSVSGNATFTMSYDGKSNPVTINDVFLVK